jgi:hypothetical protein
MTSFNINCLFIDYIPIYSTSYKLVYQLTVKIVGFLDFVQRPVSEELENSMCRKLELFPSSGERGDTYFVGSFRKS